MRTRILLITLVIALMATLVTACGGTPAPSAPAQATATPVPSTPAQATATPVPAKPTTPPASPTPAPVVKPFGDLFNDAMAKAKTATKYRMAMSFTIGATEAGQFKETPFMVLEGYVVDQDMYQVFNGGMMNESLGGAKIEMIQVGGKSYIKGMTFMGMADPNKWYLMSDTSQSSPPVDPGDMFNMTGQDLKGLKDAPKKVGNETLDGQSCEVWSWDMRAYYGNYMNFMTNPDAKKDLGIADKAESKSWLCADGYIHQVSMDIAGHDTANVAEKGSMKILTRMWDFNNASLSVKAPADAVPFGK